MHKTRFLDTSNSKKIVNADPDDIISASVCGLGGKNFKWYGYSRSVSMYTVCGCIWSLR